MGKPRQITGDNAVMQFYTPGHIGVNYGAACTWQEAIHHEGSGQMTHLKNLIESVDFINGKPDDSLLLSGQKEKYERVAVFAGTDYLIAYDYSGKPFSLDTSSYKGCEMWWVSPVTGIKSYICRCGSDVFDAPAFATIEHDNTDRVLLIK